MLFYQFVPSGKYVTIPSQLGNYKCVVLIERFVEEEFRHEVSQLLVESGCLYTMAWGLDCTLWDDSVDHANMEQFNYGKIPDDKFVLTTWHDGETLEEVLRFAKIDAVSSYSDEPLIDLLVLDLSQQNRAALIEDIFKRVE